MKSLDEFTELLDELEPGRGGVPVGIDALLRGADESGWMERGDWIAAVRTGYDRLIRGSATPSGVLSVDGEALDAQLERDVISWMEAHGIAHREPARDAWEGLRIGEELRRATSAGRAPWLEAVERAIETLASARKRVRRTTARVGPTEGGSRLWARGLTKIYKRRKVVNDVDISVTQGEIVGLLGPNGAGKTTTFYMIVGLIPPNEGDVYLDDGTLTATPMFKRARLGVGYLAQEPSIFRKLTVEENVLAILETLDLPRKEEKQRLEELLQELSISHLRKNKAFSLSGGERRRLEITRALVQRPKFMLLDEPFAGIDPIAVNDIQEIVADLKTRDIGIIISDHNVEQTLEIVDRAYIMFEGRIRVSGTVSELVWSDEVAEIYLGPLLTQRMRDRFPRPSGAPAGAL